ncbi:hypothetical protein GCM10007940_05070 [Portibacter lacus]|uniref:Uncharacterized protein n=1 Tax=Portibacter lacus TaxID=1099794 RepID=A0AA37SM39_9BACT|nr:hypothetical protein GCM10007940_05070 [Portibacter lacus]
MALLGLFHGNLKAVIVKVSQEQHEIIDAQQSEILRLTKLLNAKVESQIDMKSEVAEN